MADNRLFYYTLLVMKGANERHSVRVAVREFGDFQEQIEKARFIHFLTTSMDIFSVAIGDIHSMYSKHGSTDDCEMTFVINPVPHLYLQQVKVHPSIYINKDLYKDDIKES